MYDIKLAEYAQPICVNNLEVDTQYFQEHYHSDVLFSEEKKPVVENQGSNESEQFKSPSDIANGEKIEETKEYVEVNFQFNYTGAEESPIKISIDNDA